MQNFITRTFQSNLFHYFNIYGIKITAIQNGGVFWSSWTFLFHVILNFIIGGFYFGYVTKLFVSACIYSCSQWKNVQ